MLPNSIAKLRIDETELLNTGPVAGREQDMIDHARAAVTQLQPSAVSLGRRLDHLRVHRHAHMADDAIQQPARPRRANGAAGDRLSRLDRQMAEDQREVEQPVQSRRPDVARGIDELPSGAAVVVELQPANPPAVNQLDLGAGLVQQRRRLYSALAAPDHRDTCAVEPVQIAVGPAVRGNRFGKRFRKVRDVGEAVDPGRHHDPPRLQGPAVR